MKINKKLEVALNAVRVLRTKPGLTRTQDLAPEVGTTVHFLEQVMRNLRLAGIVRVVRGPGGGHKVNLDRTVTAYDVAKAVGRFSEDAVDVNDSSVPNQLRMAVEKAFSDMTV